MIGDERSLLRSFNRSRVGAQGFGHDIDKAGRGALAASLSFRGLGRSLTFASAQFLGGAGIVFALKQVVTEASRVQEETEKTGVVFGRNAAQVQAWSKTLASSFGISGGAALEASGRFGNMLRPLGFAPAAAARMSERLVQLAADMASFNNQKPDVVLEALASGIAGQVRPLRQFGVFLSQARIQEQALADGIAKHGAKLTQAQKVQAAYNIILKDTRLQQGDVARNTGSLSVAQSKLTASVQNLEARLGKQLLPVITEYVNKAADWLGQTANQEKIQKQLTDAVRAGVGVVKALAGAFQIALKVIRPIVAAVGGLKNALIGLAAIKLASVAAGWAGSLASLAGVAAGSTGKITALRAALLRLAAIGVITIGVEILLNKDKIDKSVTNFLRTHHLGFATGAQIQLPVNASIQDLEKLRTQYKNLGGAGDIFAKALDKVIAKMKAQRRALDESTAAFQASAKATIDAVTHLPKQTQTAAKFLGGAVAGSIPRTTKPLTAAQKNQFFDAAIGRQTDRVQDITSLKGQLAALETIAGLITKRIAVTKDVTRRMKLEDDRLNVLRQEKSVRQQIGQEFADSLSFGFTKAEATPGLKDDLKALQRINANILAQIRETGHTAELDQQLFDNTQKIAAKREEQRNRLQFKELGLGPTGQALIPQKPALTRLLTKVTGDISGTFLDTSKNQKLLAAIRKMLLDPFTKVSAEVRATILQLLNGLETQFKDHAGKPLTKTVALDARKLLSGVGLSSDAEALIRSRLVGFNSAGIGLAGRTVDTGRFGGGALAGAGAGITIPITVTMDGAVVATKTAVHNDKRDRRNATTRGGHL